MGPDLFDYRPPPRPAPPPPSGRSLAEKGITESAEHAEGERPGWSDDALQYFRRYAAAHLSFLTEDARQWAYDSGLDEPPAVGAWGNVVRRAVKLAIVEPDGTAPSKTPAQHAKLMRRWSSRIYGEGPRQ